MAIGVENTEAEFLKVMGLFNGIKIFVWIVGIGTLIATMLPYTLVFFVGWVTLFYLWVFVFNLPVGPGAPTYYQFGG